METFMIQPEDLMIGNYILFQNEDLVGIVQTIYSDSPGVDIKFPDEETYIGLDQFGGIPLTEQWLVDFGAKINRKGLLQVEDFEFSIGADHTKVFYKNYFLIDVIYVHSTQNLYKSLTGNQLKKNP